MYITVYSFFMAVFWASILTVALYAIRKHPVFIKRFGVFNVGLIYLFCIIRMLLPIEIGIAKIIYMTFFFNPMTDGLRSQLMTIATQKVTVLEFLVFVWFAVSTILIFRFIPSYLLSRRSFLRIDRIDDVELQNMLDKIQKETGKSLNIRVSYANSIYTPTGMGILKKQIVLPNKIYSEEELYLILKHEYTHFINHDLAVTMMVHLYSYIFWWNPTVYLLKKDLEQVLEIKCDLSVTAGMGVSQKAQYLKAILLHIKGAGTKIIPFPVGKVSLLGQKTRSHLEERFEYIHQNSKKTNSYMIQIGFMTFALSLFVLSYSFVLQSRFEAPIEEIETSSEALIIRDEEIIIYQYNDGTYMLIIDGEKFDVDKQIAESYIEQGAKFKQE